MKKKRINKCNRARQTLYTGYGSELLQWARPDTVSVQAWQYASMSDPGSLREDLSRKKVQLQHLSQRNSFFLNLNLIFCESECDDCSVSHKDTAGGSSSFSRCN